MENMENMENLDNKKARKYGLLHAYWCPLRDSNPRPTD